MKTRMSVVILALLLLPMLLGACAGPNVESAEKFLQAVSDGDAEEAKKYTCDDEKGNVDSAIATFTSVNAEIKDIKCKADGSNVKCDYTLSVAGTDEKLTSVYKMDGDKVCGELAE
jgi:hypothetical protein